MLRSPRPPVERAAGAVLNAVGGDAECAAIAGPNVQQALGKETRSSPGLTMLGSCDS